MNTSATLAFVLRYLHTLSAILFYILGSSFFLAYVLLHNDILTSAAASWLRIGDLPLLVSGLLYGGLSVHGSIQEDASSSKTLLFAIGIPMLILFVFFVMLNFR